MLSFKGAHGVKAILLTWVRGYVASPLSWRQGEERLEERGGSVAHATIYPGPLPLHHLLSKIGDTTPARVIGRYCQRFGACCVTRIEAILTWVWWACAPNLGPNQHDFPRSTAIEELIGLDGLVQREAVGD
jgi:hypothetical protein